jgi:hypothetical protein
VKSTGQLGTQGSVRVVVLSLEALSFLNTFTQLDEAHPNYALLSLWI